VFGNNVTLGGHVQIENNAIIGGLSAIHQWVRIGRGAMIGGMSGVERDVIPYGTVKGERAYLCGINTIGLKRANIPRGAIMAIRKMYDIIFFTGDTLFNNLKRAETMFKKIPHAEHILDFMNHKTDRSFCQPRP
jgi:UDP-N-acetylglucosamine acyltransferase